VEAVEAAIVMVLQAQLLMAAVLVAVQILVQIQQELQTQVVEAEAVVQLKQLAALVDLVLSSLKNPQ
jgi:hypothetical protein